MKLVLILVISLLSYSNMKGQIDIQGHRGARGVLPENTITAFIYALDQGVTTVEMDLAITRDKKVVVSHEPWMSHEICSDKKGNAVTEKEEKNLNIYSMTYSEVKQYDCGQKVHPRFPDQRKMKAHKPLLSEVIKAVESHIKGATHYEVDYNIEIKSLPQGDNKFHPTPEVFSDLVYNLLDQYLPLERVVIQSFDFRVLRYWHKKYPKVRLAALVENKESVANNLDKLGFKPQIYSPDYNLLTPSVVSDLRRKKIKIIPWTVNKQEDMLRLVDWKVDGIITDYPNKAKEIGLTLKN